YRLLDEVTADGRFPGTRRGDEEHGRLPQAILALQLVNRLQLVRAQLEAGPKIRVYRRALHVRALSAKEGWHYPSDQPSSTAGGAFNNEAWQQPRHQIYSLQNPPTQHHAEAHDHSPASRARPHELCRRSQRSGIPYLETHVRRGS